MVVDEASSSVGVKRNLRSVAKSRWAAWRNSKKRPASKRMWVAFGVDASGDCVVRCFKDKGDAKHRDELQIRGRDLEIKRLGNVKDKMFRFGLRLSGADLCSLNPKKNIGSGLYIYASTDLEFSHLMRAIHSLAGAALGTGRCKYPNVVNTFDDPVFEKNEQQQDQAGVVPQGGGNGSRRKLSLRNLNPFSSQSTLVAGQEHEKVNPVVALGSVTTVAAVAAASTADDDKEKEEEEEGENVEGAQIHSLETAQRYSIASESPRSVSSSSLITASRESCIKTILFCSAQIVKFGECVQKIRSLHPSERIQAKQLLQSYETHRKPPSVLEQPPNVLGGIIFYALERLHPRLISSELAHEFEATDRPRWKSVCATIDVEDMVCLYAISQAIAVQTNASRLTTLCLESDDSSGFFLHLVNDIESTTACHVELMERYLRANAGLSPLLRRLKRGPLRDKRGPLRDFFSLQEDDSIQDDRFKSLKRLLEWYQYRLKKDPKARNSFLWKQEVMAITEELKSSEIAPYPDAKGKKAFDQEEVQQQQEQEEEEEEAQCLVGQETVDQILSLWDRLQDSSATNLIRQQKGDEKLPQQPLAAMEASKKLLQKLESEIILLKKDCKMGNGSLPPNIESESFQNPSYIESLTNPTAILIGLLTENVQLRTELNEYQAGIVEHTQAKAIEFEQKMNRQPNRNGLAAAAPPPRAPAAPTSSSGAAWAFFVGEK